MDDEQERAREVNRGVAARRILEDEIFKDAIAKTQGAIFAKFAETDPRDTKGLELVRLKLQVQAEFVRELQTVMQTGKLAEQQLREMRSIRDRINRVFNR